MSASQWRRAMNSAATAAVPSSTASMHRMAGTAASVPADAAPRSFWFERVRARIKPRHLLVLAAVVLYPFVASGPPATRTPPERGASAGRVESVGAAAVAAEFIARRHCDALILPVP